MLARVIIPGTLFLAGSAIAVAVHPARDAKTSVVVATQEVTRAFTSAIAATEAFTSVVAVTEGNQPFTSVVEVTQPIATTYYSGDGVWTSSIGPVYTSGPCYCPVPVSIPPQTSTIQEPITLTVTVEPSSSFIPDAVTSVIDVAVTSVIPDTVTSVISDAVTSVVRRAAVTSVSPDVVTSSLAEPTPTTMVVTILPTSSGFPGPVTMCGCAAASTSPGAFTSTQSGPEPTTQPAGVPTTQSVQGVSTSRFASTTSLAESNNLLLNANGAVTEVVS
ncbi:hypothetical protein FRC00_012982, partial [Tulasnella sp. 408]